MSGMIERVAAAICEGMAAHLQDADGLSVQNGRLFISGADCHVDPTALARLAVEAMKYRDGADEDALIKASNAERVEAVSLAMAWDAMIEEVLNPTPTPEPRKPERPAPDFGALLRSLGARIIDITPEKKS